MSEIIHDGFRSDHQTQHCSQVIETLVKERDEALAVANRNCQWIESEDGPHETGCGHAFEFNYDGIKENGFKYCCFCGGLIQLKQRKEGDVKCIPE